MAALASGVGLAIAIRPSVVDSAALPDCGSRSRHHRRRIHCHWCCLPTGGSSCSWPIGKECLDSGFARPSRSHAEIAATVQVGLRWSIAANSTFVERGLARALAAKPRPGGKRKLTATDEALLVATACAQPPVGRARWTLALLGLGTRPAHGAYVCVPRDRRPSSRRERAEALAGKDVVRPAGRCLLCSTHGGRARSSRRRIGII